MKAKTIIISALLIVALLLGGTVQAADTTKSFNASASASKTALKAGEETTITLNLSDINMGDNGINTVETVVDYDKNVFETISSNSIQSLNNWSTTYNDANGKALAVLLSGGVKQNTSIFSIKLKVKSTVATSQTATIKFTNITSNDGTNLVSAGTKTVNINVTAQETATPAATPAVTPSSAVPSATPSTTTNKSTPAKKDTSTTAKNKIPKTGVEVGIPLIGAWVLGIALIVMVILYFKEKEIDKDIKNK